MNERNYELQALIIRTRNFQENDKLITFFSVEKGKRTALAKGVLKEKSTLRGVVQPFCHCQLAFAKSRGSLDIITQGQVIEPFLALRSDLERIAYASYIAELIDIGMPDNKANIDIFALLLAAFSLLEMHDDLPLVRHFFELRLLENMGLTPQLDHCMVCGRRALGTYFFLSPFRGGLVCANCHTGQEGLISPGTVQVIRRLLSSPLVKIPNLKISPISQKELEKALSNYLDYHLEYMARARNVLTQLLSEN
ncbi:MAG: DNA repair protein RecO [Bacillota bacterium]